MAALEHNERVAKEFIETALYEWKPHNRGNAAVDIFRLEDGKSVEHRGVVQPLLEKSANDNPMVQRGAIVGHRPCVARSLEAAKPARLRSTEAWSSWCSFAPAGAGPPTGGESG